MKPLFHLLLVFSFSLSHQLQAQEERFFVPREITQACENGTRSYDGQPGPQYWQNTVDYKIEVSVFPEEKKISGSETVVYYNNSPDDLSELIIRLYHDVFKKANSRAYQVSPDDINEGVSLSRLLINEEAYELTNPRVVSRNGTNMRVQLKQPLRSGEQLNLEMDWSHQIPETTIRTGAYDSTTFFVAYWYPQIAVYDDLFGWDNLSYDFSTEFYNNLANYDVTINTPASFTVLATGELQNPSEVFNETLLSRYQEAQKSTNPVVILKPAEATPDFSHRSGSWHYKADEVTDFSFCLSDHFSWEAASQKIADRTVLIHSFYPADKAEECKEMTTNQQKMMKHFSEDMPGIPYPYPEFTSFMSAAGGGGMETPMMANNGNPGVGVTIHEMFHTYFPMYVRVNEKRFAWMDEGWANFNTTYLNERYFKEEEGSLFTSHSSGVQSNLGTLSDLPLITSTQFMDDTNYGYASYSLPAFLFTVLHHHLGDNLFKRCYQTYIQQWAKKSPSPYDLFYTFEAVSGQDLSWLWNPWFFNYGTADISIESFSKGQLRLENKGKRPVPVFINITYKDGQKSEQSMSASIWQNTSTQKIKVPRYKEIESMEVNAQIPDANVMDNYFPALAERFQRIARNESMFGIYQVKEFPVTIELDEEEGILLMKIPARNIRQYLTPISDTVFESLDGAFEIELKQEGDVCTGLLINTIFLDFPLNGDKL